MFLSLILALSVQAAPVCKNVLVCEKPTTCACPKPVKKHKKIVKHVLPPVVIKKEVVVEKPCCQTAAPIIINNNVVVGQNQAQMQQQAQAMHDHGAGLYVLGADKPRFLAGLRGAGAMTLCGPIFFGQLGLRLNALPIHLGLDVFTEFGYGSGASLLVYPIQTPIVMWHLNAGVMAFFNQNVYVVPDLPRRLDLTVGTGLEFHVFPHLWVTVDYRLRMPNGVAIAQTGRSFGSVLGESFTESQVLVGLMLRSW